MRQDSQKLTTDQQKELWASRLMTFLPTDWTTAIGAFMGERAALQAIREEKDWVKNLHNNFAKLQGIDDPALRQKKIIEWTKQVGRVHAEFTILQRLIEEHRLEVLGQENLHNTTQPIIFVSCHLSNWELVGHTVTRLPNRVSALYVPPENPVYEPIMAKARQEWKDSTELIPASSRAIFQLTRALTSGNNLLLFIDEEKDGYIWAPSLGRKLPYAGNRWLAARLAVRHQVDIVPLYVERVGNSRYRVVIEPVLKQVDGDPQGRTKNLADQLDLLLNQWISQRLEQWYWFSGLDLDKPLPF